MPASLAYATGGAPWQVTGCTPPGGTAPSGAAWCVVSTHAKAPPNHTPTLAATSALQQIRSTTPYCFSSAMSSM